MPLPIDITITNKARSWAGYISIVLIAIPVLVLLGWQLDVYFLKTFFLPPVSMHPIVAMCFILLGLAARLQYVRLYSIPAGVLMFIVILTGLLKIASLVFGFDFLPEDEANSNTTSKISAVSAFCFVLSGISLIMRRRGRLGVCHILGLIIAFISLFFLLGYVYQVRSLLDLHNQIFMAAPAALCFFLFTLHILFSDPDKGVMKQLSSTLSGSVVARVMVPAAIAIPAVLGLLRLQGNWTGLYSDEFGTTMYVLSIIVIFVSFIWYNAWLLNKRDLLKKQTEDALREREKYIQAILQNAPDAVVVIDTDGVVTNWNQEAKAIFGWTAEEAKGRLLSELIIPPDLRERHSIGMQRYLETGQANILGKTIDIRAIRKDGSSLDVSLRVSLLRQENKKFFIGFIRDITERKEMEEKLLLFERNPLPMWMLSLPEYKVIDVNNAALEQYGYHRDEFLNLNIYDLRPPDEQERFKLNTSTSFRGIHHAGIWRHIKKDRTIIFVDIVTYDLVYMGQQTRLVLANDVTEKYIAEEKLKESYESIRKLTGHLQHIREEERLHISREIHDELGQLLTVLKMDISWLNKKLDSPGEPVKTKLGEIMGVIDITSQTIRRIASELRPSLLDDLGLLAAIEWHLEEFEKRSGIRKKLQVPDAEIPLPDAFKIGIFRIFQESLTNVARHSGATEVMVSLSQENKQLALIIRDNGNGLADKQGNRKTLGLLGMKERSQVMGGQYNISSNPGEGTTVTVIVPLPDTDL
ncbi:MAG TPA: PAS domain S-box protein [Chitinophagaceae bacterium]|nr:PAS domain S-box protein [Chitinophagaceae bacterium]